MFVYRYRGGGGQAKNLEVFLDLLFYTLTWNLETYDIEGKYNFDLGPPI